MGRAKFITTSKNYPILLKIKKNDKLPLSASCIDKQDTTHSQDPLSIQYQNLNSTCDEINNTPKRSTCRSFTNRLVTQRAPPALGYRYLGTQDDYRTKLTTPMTHDSRSMKIVGDNLRHVTTRCAAMAGAHTKKDVDGEC